MRFLITILLTLVKINQKKLADFFVCTALLIQDIYFKQYLFSFADVNRN